MTRSALALRALAMQEKFLGPGHPDFGLTLANLAVIHKSRGRLAESDSCGRRALAILEETLGHSHPGTVACRANHLTAGALMAREGPVPGSLAATVRPSTP